MGYCIEYNPDKKKIYPIQAKRKSKRVYLLMVAIVLFLVLTFAYKKKIAHFLIPGDSDVTADAFSHMVSDVKAGDPISDAFTAFCLEIIHNEE